MTTTVPDNASLDEGQQPSADHFLKCARRITSLLCGSVDVNGGRTVAEWERFLRSTDVSAVPGASTFQQRINAIEEQFVHSQAEVLNNSASQELQEVAGEESCIGAVSQHGSSQFPNDAEGLSTVPSNSCEDPVNEEPVTCEPACSAGEPTLNLPIFLSTAASGCDRVVHSVSTRSVGRGSRISALPSDISSRITSADSFSSMHANTSLDGALSIDLNVCANDCGSPSPVDGTTESRSSESTDALETNTVSTDTCMPKRFINWFRNPWHMHARADAASAMGDTTSLTSTGASYGSHMDITNQDTFSVLRPGHQTPKYQLYITYMKRNTCSAGDSTLSSRQVETRTEDLQNAFGDQNEPHGADCFPGYGRGSPDGLSDEESSTDTLSSEEIVIVDDSDMEAPDGLDGQQQDSLSGHLEQPEDSRPASALSLVSEDSEDDRSGQSWLTDTPEDDGDLPGRITPPPVTVLGMLPAGYHQSDDNLFGQRNSALTSRDAQRNSDLTAEESEWIQTHHPLPYPLPEERDVPAGHRPYLATSANVIASLECPVCFNYMNAPIWLCVNGHNVCGHCQRRVFTCPVCRGRLLCTRNLALEAIARNIIFRPPRDHAEEDDSVIVLEEEIFHPADITVDATAPDNSVNDRTASSVENEQVNVLQTASGHVEAVNGKPLRTLNHSVKFEFVDDHQ